MEQFLAIASQQGLAFAIAICALVIGFYWFRQMKAELAAIRLELLECSKARASLETLKREWGTDIEANTEERKALRSEIDAHEGEITALRAERGECFENLETERIKFRLAEAQALAFRNCAIRHGATEDELNSLTLAG